MQSNTLTSETPWQGLDQLAYLSEQPKTSAVLKQAYSDFKVNERLGFEFSGAGEHLYLQVKKTDLSTIEVAKKLASSIRQKVSTIGYAGMKDKRGECTQWFSVPYAELADAGIAQLESENLKILSTARNSRKLKIGSHKQNDFEITLRRCQGDKEEFDSRLRQIAASGVPNYFGSQRFGHELSNLQQLSTVLGDERSKRFKRSMVISAARAYVFNQILSVRIVSQSWDKYLPGDVLNLNGTDRCFLPGPEDSCEALENRLRSFDIHPTGLLVGITDNKDKYVSSAEAADIECAVAKNYPSLVNPVVDFGVRAGRRPLRFMPKDLGFNWQDNETLTIKFSLGRGAYATSLLREVCVTQ